MIYALGFQQSFTSSSNTLVRFLSMTNLIMATFAVSSAKARQGTDLRTTSLLIEMALPATSKNSQAIWMGSKTYLHAYIPSAVQGE